MALEVFDSAGQETSFTHIPTVAMTADSIFDHQVDQLVPVRRGIDYEEAEDILSLGYKDISTEQHSLPIENSCS